jgi:hypothetical protein
MTNEATTRHIARPGAYARREEEPFLIALAQLELLRRTRRGRAGGQQGLIRRVEEAEVALERSISRSMPPRGTREEWGTAAVGRRRRRRRRRRARMTRIFIRPVSMGSVTARFHILARHED